MFPSRSSGIEPKSKISAGSMTAAEGQKAAREKTLQIKQLQESALAALPQRKIYIVLWIRNFPPVANDFHWGFYYHKTESGGTKYHMRNLGSGWIADHGNTDGVFKSLFLCVLIEIGSIHVDKGGILDQIMRSYDSTANSTPGFSCRVWIFMILKFLIG